MNGNQTKIDRFVVDTNVIFMALYDENSKAGKIIEFANKNKIQLFSPESVKEELFRVLKREMDFSEDKINLILDSLPITWIKKEFYEGFLERTSVKHEADKPIEAVALLLDCGILSADKHFKDRADINKLLEDLREK